MSHTEYADHNAAPLIALIGCDGAGKSTLSADIVRALAGGDHPVEYAYLGLGSGDLGRRITNWPLIGRALGGILTKKAKTTRTKGEKIPGSLTASVVFGFSLLRFWRFRKALRAREHGVAIITDRYPQAEIAGWCDGPGLSAASTSNPYIAWLARIEKRLYQRMASVHPDLIIVLDVDAATAFSRKPDHDPDLLRTKIDVTRKITFDGAPLKVIDARQDYSKVREIALSFIRQIMNPPAVEDYPLPRRA